MTPVTAARGVELEARSVRVCRGGKCILEDVSFKIVPGTLTAMIGPNGAGKTTLMRALSGERPTSGTVLLNGEDLYASPQYWLQKVGYVPADNVLHEQLPLREALIFVGRLRLFDQPVDKIAERVDLLLEHFDFKAGDDRRYKPLRVLSTGERKRANICAELIADPPLLLLDEPTSNLDPDAESKIMQLLADYAHSDAKTTILVITHTLNTIDVCDAVIFVENGRLRSIGPAQTILDDLEKTVPQTRQARSSFYRWAHVFASYPTRPDLRKPCAADRKPPAAVRAVTHATVTAPWLYQLGCLLRRYIRVRIGDRWNLLLTLVAGLSGLLFFVLPAKTFVRPADESQWGVVANAARQSIYVVSLIVTLLGLITSYTDISKEYRIYKHERLKGLSPSAYFVSKWLWLTLIVGILAPVLLMGFIVLFYQQPLPGFPEARIGETVGWLESLLRFQVTGLVTAIATRQVLTLLILSCITSITVGLLISALAGDSDKGYLYLTFVAVFVVLFSGLLHNKDFQQLVDTMSFVSPARWAYEGFASTVNLYCWSGTWRFEEYNSTGRLASIYVALPGLALAAALLAVVVLRLRDSWFSPWQNFSHLGSKNWGSLLVCLALLALLFSYTLYLRERSYEYHALTYDSVQALGGDNANHYANINHVRQVDPFQYWNGLISQSWCGEQ